MGPWPQHEMFHYSSALLESLRFLKCQSGSREYNNLSVTFLDEPLDCIIWS